MPAPPDKPDPSSQQPWTARNPIREDLFVIGPAVLAALSLFSSWSDRLRVLLGLLAMVALALVVPLTRRWRAEGIHSHGRTVVTALLAIAAVVGGMASVLSLVGERGPVSTSIDVAAVNFRLNSDERTAARTLDGNGTVNATTGDTVQWTIGVKFDPEDDTILALRVVFPNSLTPTLDASLTPAASGPGFFLDAESTMAVTVTGHVDASALLCGQTEFMTVTLEGSAGVVATEFTPLVLLDEASCDAAEAVTAGVFYPDREFWDWKVDQIGPTEYPVLNSYINTPQYGDERGFLDARPRTAEAAGSYRDLTAVSAFGDHVVVRLFAVNSSNEAVEPLLTARETIVRLAIPTANDRSLRVRGYIGSENAIPSLVENTTDFTSGTPFRLVYVPGSARMYTGDGEVQLSDDIVKDGVLIGSLNNDGLLEPGMANSVVVEIELLTIPS